MENHGKPTIGGSFRPRHEPGPPGPPRPHVDELRLHASGVATIAAVTPGHHRAIRQERSKGASRGLAEAVAAVAAVAMGLWNVFGGLISIYNQSMNPILVYIYIYIYIYIYWYMEYSHISIFEKMNFTKEVDIDEIDSWGFYGDQVGD